MLRDVILQKITAILNDEKKSINIEKSIYNFCVEQNNTSASWEDTVFVFMYIQRANDVLLHLSENSEFKRKVLDRIVKTKDVGFMKPCEFNPDMWSDEKSAVEVEDGIFTCKKCGKSKTTFYSLQTRSSDEPMTNFITCVTCNNRWKM